MRNKKFNVLLLYSYYSLRTKPNRRSKAGNPVARERQRALYYILNGLR